MPGSEDFTIPPLAYLNSDFLGGQDARIIRILSEYMEPAARLRRFRVRDTIVFFGSARSVPPELAQQRLDAVRSELKAAGTPGAELVEAEASAVQAVKLSRYYNDATELARRMTQWSKALTGDRHFIICSGGSGGMMEAANRGASMARGKTIGLNIELPFEQEINPFV